jgi:hypothetical protein
VNERPDKFKRQQRRRAIIAWTSVGIVVALFAIGAIFGGEEDHGGGDQQPGPFGYSMTAAQYAGLRPGLDETDFVNRLEQTGLPEHLTKARYVELFPPHTGEVICSYWEISDRPERVARICFSDPDARLVQKLERDASAEPLGVTA